MCGQPTLDAFNRTRVELKLINRINEHLRYTPLIVPEWN